MVCIPCTGAAVHLRLSFYSTGASHKLQSVSTTRCCHNGRPSWCAPCCWASSSPVRPSEVPDCIPRTCQSQSDIHVCVWLPSSTRHTHRHLLFYLQSLSAPCQISTKEYQNVTSKLVRPAASSNTHHCLPVGPHVRISIPALSGHSFALL
jgi:hypothetical protein